MSAPHLSRAADQQRLAWLHGGEVSVLLDGQATDAKATVLRHRFPAGSTSPVHLHTREDESCVMIEGSGIFWAGDQRHLLSAGDVLAMPGGVPHAYRITADSDFLTMYSPGGIEAFFQAAGWDLSQPKPDDWAPTAEAMTAAAIHHGQRILGRPLGPGDTMPAAYLPGI